MERPLAWMRWIVGLVVCLSSLAHAQVAGEPPPAPREFRAAWVATVNNVDWPSRRDLTSDEQKREIVAICDRAAELRLNCLIVQVRPSADALYVSKLEPWSVYLTGTPGVGPSPSYDPLNVWIDEAHRRGIAIHAWINPFRARIDETVGVAPTHVSKTDPSLVVKYGDKLWLDPGDPASAKRTLAVVEDLVRRYDIDGLHIDDYFYPYPIAGKDKRDLPFPDDASWSRYKRSHALARGVDEATARADWRRANVNALVESLYAKVKSIKPRVLVGISPFGIPRKGRVPGVSGMDQYDKLYADAELWLRSGWCDYFSPQLYWTIDSKQQAFGTLLSYWTSENTKGRHVWPGLIASNVLGSLKGYSPAEIVNEVRLTRKSPDAGHAHFSMTALMPTPGPDRAALGAALSRDVYQTDALVPPSPWLDDRKPARPEANRKGDVIQLRGDAFRWAIWQQTPAGWSFATLPGERTAFRPIAAAGRCVVSAVDRLGNESLRIDVPR